MNYVAKRPGAFPLVSVRYPLSQHEAKEEIAKRNGKKARPGDDLGRGWKQV